MTTDILKERQAWTLAQKSTTLSLLSTCLFPVWAVLTKCIAHFPAVRIARFYYTFAEFFILTFWRCFALPATNTPK